ncbi:MAG: hypothetical protein ABFD46_09185 [Armatimonadota bacterium]
MTNFFAALGTRVISVYLFAAGVIKLPAGIVSMKSLMKMVSHVNISHPTALVIASTILWPVLQVLFGILLWFAAEKIGTWVKDTPDAQETPSAKGEQGFLRAGLVVSGVALFAYSLPILIRTIYETVQLSIAQKTSVGELLQAGGLSKQMPMIAQEVTQLVLGLCLIFYSGWIIDRLWDKNNIIREISPVEPESD